MPSFNMTDLDWLNLYSELASWSTMAAANPGAGLMNTTLTTKLTFGASETFTEFDISLPFQLPAGCGAGAITFDGGGDVTLTAIGPTGAGYNLSGTNSSDSSVNLGIVISYTFSFPVPPQ
jgi:hypothetical protein